jgi:ankyrin repeat protein
MQLNNLGETPLYLAACAGNSDIIAFILEELSETGKAEALSKPTNDRQLTPLHIAIIEGHKDVVRLLLEAGSDAHRETRDGLSALQLAEESNQEDMVNTVSSLVQKHD